MKYEFKKDDVLVKIMDFEPEAYVVRALGPDCYFFDMIDDGKRRMTCAWSLIDKVHQNYVKVGKWDERNRVVVEDE